MARKKQPKDQSRHTEVSPGLQVPGPAIPSTPAPFGDLPPDHRDDKKK